DHLVEALTYYPAGNAQLAAPLARFLGLDPATVVLANGSTELITWADRLFVREGLATPVPTFGRWTDQPTESRKRLGAYPTRAEDGFALDVDRFVAFVHGLGLRAAAICNPNNPSGRLLPHAEVVRLLDALADLELVVIDES